MKEETLQEKSVSELREMASKKEVEGRSSMSKDELVSAMATTTKPTDKKIETLKTESPLPGGPQATGNVTIKGAELGGKNPTRLFQTGPDEKTWLTKDQATEKGFFWKD